MDGEVRQEVAKQLVKGYLVHTGGAELVDEINERGFERFAGAQ